MATAMMTSHRGRGSIFEEVQRELIAILRDRTKPIGVRVDEYLDRANEYQKKLSENDVEKHIDWLSFNDFSFEHFDIRFGIINEMELLRGMAGFQG